MPINVGVSELPGRTHGKMQVMSNVQAGLNLRAAIFELERDYGEVATVNEADRPRPVQLQLRADYLRFLAGGPWAPLAAYCTAGPPPYFTSTHDPDNVGDGADLGGPGGAVLSVRAHNLLDGDHPDGVLGRKYGLYNTGKHFSTPEWWHFNIFPSRAQRRATLADSTAPAKPKPEPIAPPKEDDMQVVWNHTHTAATISAGSGAIVIDKETPARNKMDWRAQIKICERVTRIDPKASYPGGLNNAETAVWRAILADCRKAGVAEANAALVASIKQLKKEGVL